MSTEQESISLPTFTAFTEGKSISNGNLKSVIRDSKAYRAKHSHASILIFEDADGSWFDVDLNGSLALILKTLPARAPVTIEEETEAPVLQAPTRGRPKLGVVSKEVTLLPRHWEWLSSQKGGASVTLRKLVETAKKTSAIKEKTRRAEDACNQFIVSIAGDYSNYEEATRALYASEYKAFEKSIKGWPEDIKQYAMRLLTPAIDEKTNMSSSLEWLDAITIL